MLAPSLVPLPRGSFGCVCAGLDVAESRGFLVEAGRHLTKELIKAPGQVTVPPSPLLLTVLVSGAVVSETRGWEVQRAGKYPAVRASASGAGKSTGAAQWGQLARFSCHPQEARLLKRPLLEHMSAFL